MKEEAAGRGAHSNRRRLSGASARLDFFLEHEGVEAALEGVVVLLPLELRLILALELGC
jgi:hypothetical protein